MISSLHGRLIQKNPTLLVVDVHGVGYAVNISLASYQRVGPVGSEVNLLTYLHVREDILQLYGFSTEEERELFGMLIAISGIGPKMAQSILSGISVKDFKGAIVNNNIDVLMTISGIGRKTAQRLIVELKEKLGDTEDTLSAIAPTDAAETTLCEEAILALISLGYKRARAKAAVQKIIETRADPLPLEEVIRHALRHV